jgi:hypothetical protein
MGQAPYDEPDALDRMRADADQVELVVVPSAAHVEPGEPSATDGFDVPSDAVDLSGRLHVYLD